MAKHLVLIGGGHAHMVTLQNISQIIARGHRVTVIGPSPHHYYSGMGPGMLGTTYSADDIRFNTKTDVETAGGVFLLDTVERIDPVARQLYLAGSEPVSYDVLSCNAGSYVSKSCVKQDDDDIFTVKPIETLQKAKERILAMTDGKECQIAIVGGGPSAAEIAGNILQLTKSSGRLVPKIHIYSGRQFMARFPGKIRKLVQHSLINRGIIIHEGDRVEDVQSGRLKMASGELVQPDLIFLALGVKPSRLFELSELPIGPDGGLLVNEYLQSTGYPEIFGGGDCIYFAKSPLDKVGVYAVRQNPILYNNLLASLEGEPLQGFDPGGDYLLIFNLGEGLGVFHKSWLTFGGKLAFSIKDYIDRRFMRRFQ